MIFFVKSLLHTFNNIIWCWFCESKFLFSCTWKMTSSRTQTGPWSDTFSYIIDHGWHLSLLSCWQHQDYCDYLDQIYCHQVLEPSPHCWHHPQKKCKEIIWFPVLIWWWNYTRGDNNDGCLILCCDGYDIEYEGERFFKRKLARDHGREQGWKSTP